MIPVRVLAMLPWTIERRDEDEDGESTVELTIAELDGFIVAGETDEDVEKRFWPALELYLQSYVDEGKLPPLPDGIQFEQITLEPQKIAPRTNTAAESGWDNHLTAGLRFGVTQGRLDGSAV